MAISPKGLQLILDGEVGGGREYYDKFCRHPIVPDQKNTKSGVTIGIGYDLGQSNTKTFQGEWNLFITDAKELAALGKVCGLRGSRAVAALRSVREITIEWPEAIAQFQMWTLPRIARITQSTFHAFDTAPACVQEALISLVFNRGTSMFGDRRSEMREIRYLVAAGNWEAIPEQLREMKRLWPKTPGLLDRREGEAKHIEEGLASK